MSRSWIVQNNVSLHSVLNVCIFFSFQKDKINVTWYWFILDKNIANCLKSWACFYDFPISIKLISSNYSKNALKKKTNLLSKYALIILHFCICSKKAKANTERTEKFYLLKFYYNLATYGAFIINLNSTGFLAGWVAMSVCAFLLNRLCNFGILEPFKRIGV